MNTHRRAFLQASTALATTALVPGAARAADPLDRLYRNALVIDGNLVAPLDDAAPLDAQTAAQVRSSGLTALKMTIGGSRGGYSETKADIAAFDKAMLQDAGLYMKIVRPADLLTAKRTGRVGIIYSFESAEMLEGKPERIDEFAALGVRIMQLGYNTASPFAGGCMTPQPSSGLTPLGREAVARMNGGGVSLDLSHADERSTLQAITAAAKPPLITHAGCDAVYAHPRNKSDAVLRALAAKGGVVGLYELCFISAGPAQQSLDEYMAHVVHALKVCGEEHVGIGSDAVLTPFDTGPESMAMWDKDIAARKAAGVSAPGEGRPPFVVGLNRPDRSRVIAGELLKRGYRTRTIEKVLGANFQRVFAETWG